MSLVRSRIYAALHCAFPGVRTLFARLCAVLGGRECPLSGVASEVCGERDSPSAPRAGALWWVVPGACARGHELKARRCGANEAGVCTGRAAARTARDQLTHLLILHIHITYHITTHPTQTHCTRNTTRFATPRAARPTVARLRSAASRADRSARRTLLSCARLLAGAPAASKAIHSYTRTSHDRTERVSLWPRACPRTLEALARRKQGQLLCCSTHTAPHRAAQAVGR